MSTFPDNEKPRFVYWKANARALTPMLMLDAAGVGAPAEPRLIQPAEVVAEPLTSPRGREGLRKRLAFSYEKQGKISLQMDELDRLSYLAPEDTKIKSDLNESCTTCFNDDKNYFEFSSPLHSKYLQPYYS